MGGLSVNPLTPDTHSTHEGKSTRKNEQNWIKMADCCSRRCRGDSSSSQISVIHWCSYSQVGKRAGYVCICSLRAPHAVCFALCLCSCSAWVGRRNRCNDGEPEPAQPKLNSGEPNEWGGKAFWPIAAVKPKLQRRVFPCADAKWRHRDAWRPTKFLFLFDREKADDTHHHHEENEIRKVY